MPSFRRSHHSSSTYHDYDLRFENRNSEDVHREALAASYAEHQRIQQAAVRAAQLEEARLEQLRLQQHAVQEEERVQFEEERVRQETRLREIENRARQIPKVPERVPTPPPKPAQPPPHETKAQPPPTPQTTPAAPTPPTQQAQQPTVTQPPTTQASNPFHTRQPQIQKPPVAQASNPFAPTTPQTPNTFAQKAPQSTNAFAPQQAAAPTQPQPQATTTAQSPIAQAQAHLLMGVDRYVQIHRNLKELRQFVNNAGNNDKQFKKVVGELRRTLRMAVGQCVPDKSKNRAPVAKIVGVLQQSLAAVQSPGIDPSSFMVTPPPAPADGAIHNGDQLPALFIFLLNFFAKYVVSQFINEAGVNWEVADPIGVVAVQVFSRAEFRWRGESMIDVIMAKFRKTCPVLFGIRGNEKSEEGRARVGWIKDDSGQYIAEEIHGTRMYGLAAGYAAICLRDFSKSKLKSPWHPTHYWQSMASIVSTPPDQRSITQYLVLRGLIDNYEGTFMKFYGNAARAALKVALVTFPAQAGLPGSAVPPSAAAVGGVTVLADKLARDRGIELRS